jgi:ribosomal protein S18 acetylase RimI-like enzyme
MVSLERRGFHSLGIIAVTRVYDLTEKVCEPVRLKPHYRIVDMVENGDYRGKGLLYLNGFSGKDEVSEFDLARFAYSRESPAYDPRCDLSVIAPGGAHVATCVGFNDPDYRMAEIEKVCTHSDYRRQGLAEAVIRECFHRLHQRGIAWAYITSYGPEADALYEKLGPCGHKQWFHYALETSDGLERTGRGVES